MDTQWNRNTDCNSQKADILMQQTSNACHEPLADIHASQTHKHAAMPMQLVNRLQA